MERMAQLIKFNRCISRYQMDFLRYSSRFVRLKKKRLADWKENDAFPKRAARKPDGKYDYHASDVKEQEAFDEWLFTMQLNWATRTAWERSGFPDEIRRMSWLRTLLHEVNDLTFVLYNPVIRIKSASVQLEPLVITSDTVWCVKPLTGEDSSVFQELTPRKWREIRTGTTREWLNPLISLNRTRVIVAAFLDHNKIGMKTRAAVYSPLSYIEFVHSSRTTAVDIRNAHVWYRELSMHSLMMKSEQILTADALLQACETEAVSRFQGAVL
ncbi:hypothetical protein EWI07_06185 [Sporolactobacillus sp. THM7-4]|nr:hypothetical protein EWI07_06185 [Sporolactobacillus sp. THM7-4]